ncbi:NADPH--hemo protein reductase [Lipomyces doorenjongii]
MATLDPIDGILLAVLLICSFIYLVRLTFAPPKKSDYDIFTSFDASFTGNQGSHGLFGNLKMSGKNCAIFYGSQTGTAEGFANALSKECSQRFGLKTAVVDLNDFGNADLKDVPDDMVAIFVLATYGEGEPTDNAVSFQQYVMSLTEDSVLHDKVLQSLKYVIFGLGNTAYEHYNAFARRVDEAFQKLGAARIGVLGEGNDGGSIEDDFLSWKETMWRELSQALGLQEKEVVYQPLFDIKELESSSTEELLHGKFSDRQNLFNGQGTHFLPIVHARELFHSQQRNCLHLEFDTSGSGIRYETGDHLAIWPANSVQEFNRFISVFGLSNKLKNVINIKAVDAVATKAPFPCPTTYETLIRFCVEIGASVSRRLILSLAPFAPDVESKAILISLGNDPHTFHARFTSKYYNIAQALESVTSLPWVDVPFSLLLESIPRLQPRYYSISSSASVQPKQIAITCVVESVTADNGISLFKGLNTNYLRWMTREMRRAGNDESILLEYPISKTRDRANGFGNSIVQVPAYVRHSNFRLPSKPEQPVVMIGPGTGVAPFRAFIQERAAQAKAGLEVGRTILFYGCRSWGEDFLYRDEWDEMTTDLGDRFTLIVAFSRANEKKTYVQHKLFENASIVGELILKHKANIYVCGDANNMAREVNAVISQIIAEKKGVSLEEGKYAVKAMKTRGAYQEDIW